jgi:DNA-binding MarR family transcriptional regulator
MRKVGELVVYHVEPSQVAILQEVSLQLTRQLRKHSKANLTLSQMSALSTLRRIGPMRVSDLARREQISKSTATKLVARLEETGYLDREVDPVDGRSFSIAITRAGHAYLRAASERANEYLTLQVEALSEEDRAILLSALPVLSRLVAIRD